MSKKLNNHIPTDLSKKEKDILEEDMRFLGYLLPTNDEELEEFEKIYGSTQVIIPEHLKSSDFLFERKKNTISKVPTAQKENKEKEYGAKIDTKRALVKSISKNTYFKRLVLSAEIAAQLHEEPTFGHIKFVKVQYLCEQVCNMQLNFNYSKFAAGPLDPKHIYTIDSEFKKRKWFNVTKTKYGYKYEPLDNLDSYKQYYLNYFSDQIEQINYIISLFKKEKSDFCEIVATLFAVWKEKATNSLPINNEGLINDFYAWSENKKRFKEKELLHALAWMNNNNIFPKS